MGRGIWELGAGFSANKADGIDNKTHSIRNLLQFKLSNLQRSFDDLQSPYILFLGIERPSLGINRNILKLTQINLLLEGFKKLPRLGRSVIYIEHGFYSGG